MAFKEREAGVGRADEQQLVGEAGGVGVRPPGTGGARSENRVRAGGEDAGRGLGRGHTHQSAGPPDSRLSSV